jgi:hypothetical protein
LYAGVWGFDFSTIIVVDETVRGVSGRVEPVLLLDCAQRDLGILFAPVRKLLLYVLLDGQATAFDKSHTVQYSRHLCDSYAVFQALVSAVDESAFLWLTFSVMPPAPKRPARPPSAHRATQQARCRDELARLTAFRQLAEAQVTQAKADIARLLPEALAYSLPVDQVAAITEISKPTLYRMLADATKLQNLRGRVQELEALIRQVTADVGHPCLPQDLADRRGTDLYEIDHDLVLVHRLLRDDIGTSHNHDDSTIPSPRDDLPIVEQKILKMLLDQGKSKKRIAAATGLTENEVVTRASLALLRLGPSSRAELRRFASPHPSVAISL